MASRSIPASTLQECREAIRRHKMRFSIGRHTSDETIGSLIDRKHKARNDRHPAEYDAHFEMAASVLADCMVISRMNKQMPKAEYDRKTRRQKDIADFFIQLKEIFGEEDLTRGFLIGRNESYFNRGDLEIHGVVRLSIIFDLLETWIQCNERGPVKPDLHYKKRSYAQWMLRLFDSLGMKTTMSEKIRAIGIVWDQVSDEKLTQDAWKKLIPRERVLPILPRLGERKGGETE